MHVQFQLKHEKQQQSIMLLICSFCVQIAESQINALCCLTAKFPLYADVIEVVSS